MDLHKSLSISRYHVVALPFPGRGHINPLMCLCKSMASRNSDMLISVIVTEEWFGYIGSDPKPENIQFVCIPNVIPSEKGRGADSPGFYETVLRKIRAPVEMLIDWLEPQVKTIIADTYLIWSVEIGNQRNIPVASLWTMSATVLSFFYHFDLLIQHRHYPVDVTDKGEEPIDYIPGVPPIQIVDIPTCFYGKGLKVLDRSLEAISWLPKAQYLLLPSIYELESPVIDVLKSKIPIPVYHIGPTIPHLKIQSLNANSSEIDTIQLDWLNKQPNGSVLYVSNGSLHSPSKAQIEEIAAGLKDSGVRYFWVGREECLKLKENCGEMGMVVPWCDQLDVLCHSSIGGFWSHCGWNSTSEALFAGIPLLTFPIYWDQVTNSKMIVEDWKIGWKVKRGFGDEVLVKREEIAELVRRFMDVENEEEVKEMRKRAKQIRDICRKAVGKGGSSHTHMEAFVNDLSKSKMC